MSPKRVLPACLLAFIVPMAVAAPFAYVPNEGSGTVSIDETQPASFHYDLGRQLAPLRDEGVLIMGSGNLVHNLHAYGWGRHVPEPYDWAVRFETSARNWMLEGNHAPLIGYDELGDDAMLAAPTPDHYLPLLYALGAQQEGEAVTFPVEGVDGGSVSMLSVRIG